MGHLKLEAKTIYEGIHEMTGISEGTLNAALKGDESAQDQILKYNEDIVRQAAIADTIITAMNDGMEAHGRLIETQANFLKQAGSTITTATKSVASVNKASLQLGHATTEILQRSKLENDQLNQRHKQKICLTPMEFGTQRQIDDIKFQQRKYQLLQDVNIAKSDADASKKQLTPRQQNMETLRELSGSANRAGSGVGGFLGRMFNGLFGV